MVSIGNIGAFVNDRNVYFRAPLLLSMVWFLWGVNVFVFRKLHINYAKVLGFDRASTLKPPAICMSAVVLFLAFTVCWAMYSVRWPFEDVLIIPSVMYVGCLFVFLIPLDVLHRKGRERLIQNLLRVFMPGPEGVLFVEVLLGDVLTSLSKALADIQVSLCVLLSHSFSTDLTDGASDGSLFGTLEETRLRGGGSGGSGSGLIRTSATLLQNYEESCAESWMRPMVTSLPFLLRLRQCLHAYRVTGDAFPHLVNAAKYASAFPVIWISAFAHHFPESYGPSMRKTWLLAISFNSFFSFMWDVVMDWGLCRQDTEYVLLRRKLLFMTQTEGRSFAHDEDQGVELMDPKLRSMRRRPSQEMPQEHDVQGDEDELDRLLQDGDGFPKGLHSIVQSGKEMLGFDAGTDLAKRRHGAQQRRMPSAAPNRGHHLQPFFLPLMPSTPVLYYAAIVLDFLLRVLWSFKLSVHLHLTQEGLTFVLEICEVFRRSVWLLFRIEWEVLNQEALEIALRGGADSDAESLGSGDLDLSTPRGFKALSPSFAASNLAADVVGGNHDSINTSSSKSGTSGTGSNHDAGTSPAGGSMRDTAWPIRESGAGGALRARRENK
ncbi:Xenotropic and polytropic retrovirus receptor 1 (Protein SYG1 homolog) (Xenotropic and polytropic murine leukemia virus receptor X3) (X-receptor), partial [Durusdinium trenchii]